VAFIDEQIFDGYMHEYDQCCESYRHTYTTIWAAGGLFGLISGALVGLGTQDGSLPPLIQVLAPAPLLFWYIGIFRPMDRYGELRSARACAIEEHLAEEVPELDMYHYRQFDSTRKTEAPLRRLLTLKWLWRPRVKEIVNLVGVILIAAEVALVWVNYL
jgi:hypothetical protein